MQADVGEPPEESTDYLLMDHRLVGRSSLQIVVPELPHVLGFRGVGRGRTEDREEHGE